MNENNYFQIRRKYYLGIALAALITLTLACSLPMDFIGSGNEAAVGTSVAQTVAAQDPGGGSVDAPGEEGDGRTPTSEVTQPVTETPTQAPTTTPTQATPKVHVSANTNCRTGPGEVYDLSGIAPEGSSLEAFARDPNQSFWFVAHPDQPGEKCWVWDEYATPEGPTGALPVYTPMPTPTPQPTATPAVSFNVAFHEIESCVVDNILEFKITNTGDLPLEYVAYDIEDTDKNLSESDSYNYFDEWNHCPEGSSRQKVDPGKTDYFVGYGTDAYLFSGNNFKATITACTQDNRGGTCVSRTITFTAR